MEIRFNSTLLQRLSFRSFSYQFSGRDIDTAIYFIAFSRGMIIDNMVHVICICI